MATMELRVIIDLPPTGRLDICARCLTRILCRTAEGLIRGDLRCKHPSQPITPEAITADAWLRRQLEGLGKEGGS